MIKAFSATVFTALLLFAFGAQAQEVKVTPNLKGTWESSSQMHSKKDGHVKPEGDKVGKMTVLSQEGRVIHGTISWSHAKTAGKDTFSGVIAKDETTVYIAGHEEGTRIAKMDGADAMTLYILVPGGKNPRAGFAEFKRVKE